MKKFIAILLCLVLRCCLAAVAETAETESKPILGTLGGYVIKYVAPENYQISIINSDNNTIYAIAASSEADQPAINLSIAFNESYVREDGNGMRLNEVSEEDMALIHESFEENTEVKSFEEGETAFGTKVLIVRGTIGEKEYADVYSIYNAYEVEALIMGGTGTEDPTLTSEQVQMIIDFFSNIDFEAA